MRKVKESFSNRENINDDIFFMKQALIYAKEAFSINEVPVGCVIVACGEILGVGSNRREIDGDPTAHAEIIALREAGRKLGSWRLEGATAYVTCEPCPMCAGAMLQARVKRVVIGCMDPKGGGIISHYGIGIDGLLNHKFEVVSGVLEKESAEILRQFFRKRRK